MKRFPCHSAASPFCPLWTKADVLSTGFHYSNCCHNPFLLHQTTAGEKHAFVEQWFWTQTGFVMGLKIFSHHGLPQHFKPRKRSSPAGWCTVSCRRSQIKPSIKASRSKSFLSKVRNSIKIWSFPQADHHKNHSSYWILTRKILHCQSSGSSRHLSKTIPKLKSWNLTLTFSGGRLNSRQIWWFGLHSWIEGGEEDQPCIT